MTPQKFASCWPKLGARRAAHKRGERPSKKTAITAHELRAMIKTCDEDLVGMRDRALLFFSFASGGGRRRSETASARVENLTHIEDGYLYRLDVGKTLQDGVKTGGSPDKPIVGEPAQALRAWLHAAGIQQGPLFRQLAHGRVGGTLSPKSVATIIQNRAKAAGLAGDYGGHSLHSGFVTEGARQGIALPAIMAMTDHRSVVKRIKLVSSLEDFDGVVEIVQLGLPTFSRIINSRLLS